MDKDINIDIDIDIDMDKIKLLLSYTQQLYIITTSAGQVMMFTRFPFQCQTRFIKVEVLLQRGCFFCLVGRLELNKNINEPRCLPKCSQLVHLGRQVGQHNALLASSWCPSSVKFGPRPCKIYIFMQSRTRQNPLKT